MNRIDVIRDDAPTSDGWRLALRRFRSSRATRRHPVVLCHGLAANHHTFDLAESVSLARHLARHGYDVWALELRGHGDSRPVKRRLFGWDFDGYLRRDLPAALRHVARKTSRPAVHWIGHSMGGILLYARAARFGAERIRSGVAIGSGLDYSGTDSDFHALRKLLALPRHVPAIPFHRLARAWAPLAARIDNPIDRFNFWLPNVEPHHARLVYRRAFHSCSAPVLLQLATAFEPGGLKSRERTRILSQLGTAPAPPILAIAGDKDRQCSPESASRPVERLGRSAQLAVFSDYGHFDLIMGKRAPAEVWPRIVDWLDAHD